MNAPEVQIYSIKQPCPDCKRKIFLQWHTPASDHPELGTWYVEHNDEGVQCKYDEQFVNLIDAHQQFTIFEGEKTLARKRANVITAVDLFELTMPRMEFFKDYFYGGDNNQFSLDMLEFIQDEEIMSNDSEGGQFVTKILLEFVDAVYNDADRIK